MSIGMNPFGIPFMQNVGTILPPQQQPIPTVAPITNPTPPAPPNTGRWVVVKSYQDAIRVTSSIDGTPTICMMEDDSVFYVVRNVDGRKEIGGFKYIPLTGNNNVESVQQSAPMVQQQQPIQQQPVQQNDWESRISRMEKSVADIASYMSYIKSALGEGVSNEPVSSNVSGKSSQ